MNDPKPGKSSHTVKAEAAAWLAHLRSEDRRHKDEVGFRTWLSEDVRHRRAFELITSVWDTAGGLASSVGPSWRAQRLRRAGRRVLLLCGVMAVVLLAAIGVWWLMAAQTYATEIGEQRRIALDDGSYVFLDTNTRVRVGYTKERRHIDLLEGRAYFEVVSDPRRPFLVRAGDRQVIAVGTAFDVALQEDRVAVVLVEGRVAVQPLTPSPQPETHLMSPGERIVFDGTREAVQDQPDMAQVTAWQSGRLVFDNQALVKAVVEMNRYSRRPIVIADTRLAAYRISGVYSAGDPVAFARSVSVLLPAQVEFTPTRIVLRAAEET